LKWLPKTKINANGNEVDFEDDTKCAGTAIVVVLALARLLRL
jgi:hypothetical protein